MNMELKFRRSESTVQPSSIDCTSSSTHVYIRKNIHEETRPTRESMMMTEVTTEDSNGEEVQEEVVWVYDECMLTKDEYIEYQHQKLTVQEEVLNMLVEDMLNREDG